MRRAFMLFLYLVLAAGLLLRISFSDWDSGYHMHPDERAIVLFTTPLHFPLSFAEFFSVKSPWNPHFFAYGSFPLYLLWFAGQIGKSINPLYADYALINILGRHISAIFDTGTIILIYFIGKKVASARSAFIASLFYSLSVLPIQLSHFYAVDTLLTFFMTGTLLLALRFYEKPTWKRSVALGIFLGLALATKISAVVLFVPIFLTLTSDFLFVFLKQPHKAAIWFPHVPAFLKRLLSQGLLLLLIAFLTYAITEPYALIDFTTFHQQTIEQSAMTKDAFVFPYTLQYVGKIPYVYEIKNIFFFGLGPFLAVIAFTGVIAVSIACMKKLRQGEKPKEAILLVFFWLYFLIVGQFKVGFMRYMLPLYPLFCLFGAMVFFKLFPKQKTQVKRITYILTGLLLFIWPVSFMQIYTKPNTRIQATNYILTHIPKGAKIALEHWDDAIPITGQENYTLLTLPLYDPDTPGKWAQVNQTLIQADYIILASNRLYVPLQKLTDCQKLPPGKCYPITAHYYHQLFTGGNVLYNSTSTVRFKQIAVFSDPPTIPFLNIPLNDQGADESFTVYDHPKIYIFKKVK